MSTIRIIDRSFKNFDNGRKSKQAHIFHDPTVIGNVALITSVITGYT